MRTATTDRDTILEAIAARELNLETLQDRNMDDLDFHEHAVWSIRAALEAAYKAGAMAQAEAR
jgi:hypothetical protein